MNKEEVMELMDITEESGFKYFESLADLLETDENYTPDELFEVLRDVDTDLFAEHAGTYFDQMQEAVPDDEAEFYTLVENMRKEMTGLAEACSSVDGEEDRDRAVMDLAEEIVRFHEWYIDPCLVNSVNEETGEEDSLSVRDALFRSRGEKFTGETYRYDFDDALDYELSEYVMQFSDLMGMVN
ncbi:MAG: hypothetical protein IKF54_05000 [Eubacterium sp.]|nr:hypothetical protein [Eubacterium sp.]